MTCGNDWIWLMHIFNWKIHENSNLILLIGQIQWNQNETKVYPHLFIYSKNLKDTIKRQKDAKGIRFSKILFRSKILYQVVSFIISRPSIYQSFSTSHRFFSLITLTVQILHQRVDEVEASQTTCCMPTAF